MTKRVSKEPSALPRWVQPRRPVGLLDHADPVRWSFHRALARIEPIIDTILAEYASSYWCRPVRRRELDRTGLEDVRLLWTIDGEPILEFRFENRHRSTLVVHDFALYAPLRKAIRTRHVHTRFATAADVIPRAAMS